MGVFEQSARSRVWRVLIVVKQLCCVVAPSRGAARVLGRLAKLGKMLLQPLAQVGE